MMAKKGEKLTEEHKRKIGEGVRRQSARQYTLAADLRELECTDPAVKEARERLDDLPNQFARMDRRDAARKAVGKRPHEKTDQDKLQEIQKYLGDLTFVAPEIFPSGQDVQHRVGQILGMWP